MIANHKGEIPVVVLLMPFLLGLVIGIHYLCAAYLTYFACAFTALGSIFLVLNIWYQPLRVYKRRWLGGLLGSLLLFIAGWISMISYSELNNPAHFSKVPAQYLAVQINNEPQFKNGMERATATVIQSIYQKQTLAARGTLLITLKDSNAVSLQYGDELLIPANYTAIDPPFNPAEFNYKAYLAHQNINYQVFLYPGQYQILKHNTGNPMIAYALKLRKQMVYLFKQKLHHPDAIAVASTLILGYKADLSNDVLQAYSQTGTIHVLSVSGAHVAIIYLLLQWMLGFLNGYKYGRLIKTSIILPLIWYYALLSGFSPAVCRAAVMISMVIIGNNFARHIHMLNILAASAFALLLYNPLYIVDVGFQLSYFAVAGLIIFQPLVYNWFSFENKWADKLWAACSVSLAAQVITFPLSAYYFHQFPVYFLVSNLIIIIPTMVIMYSGLAYLLLSWVPVLSTLLAWVLEKTIIWMNSALSFVEYAPFAGIHKIWLTTPEYLLCYALIITLFYFLYDKKRILLKISAGLLLLLCISFSVKTYLADNIQSIAFLNLRKNTGIIFKDGTEAIVLTNLADTDKAYRYSVQPYLDSCKISHASLYHPDQDISTSYLKKRKNLIKFHQKQIMLYNKQVCPLQLPEKLKIDYLLVNGNPYTSLSNINKNYNYQTLVIGSDNLPKLNTQLTTEARILHINYAALRRNKSFIVLSNERN